MKIPVTWLSVCSDNPERGRWDQQFVEDLLAGFLWDLPGFEYVDYDDLCDDLEDVAGRIVVFPCGHYVEHDEVDDALATLQHFVDRWDWSIIIATSDESGAFPWDRANLPEHKTALWVQTPNPDRPYPPGTHFFPLGSPSPARDAVWSSEKDLDICLVGQNTHQRRRDCFRSVHRYADRHPNRHVYLLETTGFTLGLPRDDYLDLMARTRVAPCPAGAVSPETFRMYEALDAGAVPILDALRADGSMSGYWEMLLPHDDLATGLSPGSVVSWDEIETVMAVYGNDKAAALMSSWWKQWKRRETYALRDQVAEFIGVRGERPDVDDLISVVVPTSPIPSHPSTDVIDATIASIRERLPYAQIHILVDGVRDEQRHLEAVYWEYARRLCGRVNSDPTIIPWVHHGHRHQSGMFRHVLQHLDTPYVLFVEHDTPLVGEIEFENVVFAMEHDEVAMMRFHHEVAIHPDSAHLFLETEPRVGVPYLRTVQWSQRPHLARTDWYRDIMATYFGWESRTMIEDVMHGAVQTGHVGNPTALMKGWQQWRMALWAPEANLLRSTHLDGRGTEEKFDMFIAYDDERPRGGPPEGWWR